MKKTTYIKFFKTEENAKEFMKMKNRTSIKEKYALIDGPESNFSVVDLMTAIQHGSGYLVEY